MRAGPSFPQFSRSVAGDRTRFLCGVWLVLLLALETAGCNSSAQSPPGVRVVKATDLGPIPTNPDILGRDGACSAVFQGNSVWLHGDTFLAHPSAAGFGLISNSWSYTQDLSVQGGITGFQERLDSAGAPTMILVNSAEEQAFNTAHNGNPCAQQPCGARYALWPSSIVTDTTRNQALVFYMLVFAQPGNFNFQARGNSVAVWQDLQQLPQRPAFNPPLVAGHPDLMFNQNDPNLGTASFISAGTLDVYGCGTPTNGGDKGCRLARVDPGSVQDPSAWSFYAGNGSWSPQPSAAVSVFTGSSIVSVSPNSYLQQYVAVYSPPFSQNVVMRTAPQPEGPWSSEVLAFVAMQPVQGNVYDAHAHSEYEMNDGETIFVTYSRATGTFTSQVRLVLVQLQSP